MSENLIALKYSLPISPSTGNSYKIFDNKYIRSGNVGYGATIGFRLDYEFYKRFYVLSGFSFDYLNNTITTSVSSSTNYYSFSDQQQPLTLGENINGYIPADSNGDTIWNVGIDENGIPVALDANDYDKYKIDEQVACVYISIPVKIGFSVNKKIQLSLGIINSFLLYSNISTSYPYTDDRIIENNISTVNKYMFSIQGGISYKPAKRMSIFLNYQRSLSDMIELNSRYEVKDGNKINIINIGLSYLINNKK